MIPPYDYFATPAGASYQWLGCTHAVGADEPAVRGQPRPRRTMTYPARRPGSADSRELFAEFSFHNAGGAERRTRY